MRSKNAISPEAFNILLGWLDPDRDEAGKKYELIRRALLKIFITRGCTDAEDLADQTIDRVATKVESIRDTYVGDPAHYFRNVAQKIYLEYRRNRHENQVEIEPDISVPDTFGVEYDSLKECLGKLPADQSEMVLEYYCDNKSVGIQRRKMMASDLGIEMNTLRIRVHRIMSVLEKCVKKAVGSIKK